jgi:hypothetical protein
MANPFQIFSIGAIIGVLSSIFLGNRKKKENKDRKSYTPTSSGRDSVLVDVPESRSSNNGNNGSGFDDVRDGSG